jgi:hypothetical protein
MTNAAAQPRFVDPVAAFRARAEARAYLFSIGDMDLLEAVDGLQADAEASGLVDHIGQDEVQRIMADAFRPYSREAQS